MKVKMSYQNKKIAIITVIVLILIAGISIGAYSYFKGNSDAEATTSENTTINNETMSEQNSVSEENNETSEETNTTENGSDANSSSDEANSESNNNENTSNNGSNAGTNSSSSSNNNSSNNESSNDSNNNASNNGANSNGNTADSNDNNDAELPNEEYTQTDYIETGREILVSESLKVGWINAALLRDNVSTKIDVEKPSLELNKTAEINSINPEDNGVQTGSQIAYNITVTNTSETVDANNVTVKDAIPEGTSFVEGSIAINGASNSELTDADLANGIDVNVPAGESVTVSFTVTVTAESGEIRNAAVVDGKDTPETLNPVIEASKVATSEDEVVKNDSTITYTITVTNKSNVNAITSVKDTVPEGTTLKEVKTEGSSVNEREIVWNNVTLEAGETKTFTFDVTVDEFDGESKIIRNVAVVGNDETPETETEVHYPVISSVKTADKGSVKVGETLTYTITLTNSGIVDGNVKVVDSSPIGTTFDAESGVTVSNQEGKKYSEEELNNGISVTVPAGGTVTVTFTVTVNEGVEGSIINKATIDDGTPTDEENPSVETPVIVTEKTAEVNGEVASTVEKDDVITYTIKITNIGSVEGKAIVKDTVPAGTSYVKDSLKIGEEVQNEDAVAKFFAEGLEVEVAQGETVVSFQVTVDDAENVLENGDTISNTAYVNDEPTNETETTYQEPVFESEKTANKGSVSVGEELEYTITVKNTGSAAGTAIVSDNAPEGTHFAPESIVTVSNADRTYATSELIQGIPVELNAGETATVTFTVVVNESAEGAIINKATVNGDETGEEENPETQTPIIAVNKEVSAETAKVGETLTYTITVENTGAVAGTAVVKDSAPEGTTFKAGTYVAVSNDAKQYTEQNLKSGITVNVPANGEVTVTFEVTVNNLEDGTKIKNVATVNDKDTPETETTYQEPVISSNKTSSKSAVVVGEEIEYTITVKNEGTTAGTVVVKDSAPAGTTYKTGSYVVVSNDITQYTEQNLNDGITVNVPAKGEVTVKFTVTVNNDATGTLANTAKVNEEDTPTTENPVITANKEVSAETAKVGETLTYTITVENTGAVAGTAVVKDSAPEGTTFKAGTYVAVSNDAKQYTEQNLKSGITVNVPANGEVTVTFEVTVNNLEDGTKIKNVATVNDKDTPGTETEYQEPVFNSEKTANKGSVSVGEELEYTITVKNTGSAAGTAIVSDNAPEGTHFAPESIVTVSNADRTYATSELIQGIPVELNAGETATVTFTVVVNESAEGAIINKATVNGDETGEEENPETQTPIISATKTATANGVTSTSETVVKQGDTITYTIIVTNTGDVAGKATVADEIPEGTTFVVGSIAVDGVANSELTADDLAKGIQVDIEANGTTTVSFDVTVGDLDNGATIRNVATVNGKDTPETDTEYQEPVISQNKTADKTAVVEGETITYTITVTNNGSAEGTVIVRDEIPTNTTFVANSIKVNDGATSFKEEDLASGIEVSVPAKSGETAGTTTVTFQVTVNEKATGSISNTAYVKDDEGNKEEPTNPVVTPIITAVKTATIGETTAETVKVGDIITYTITLTNTGSQTGTVKVTDSIPTGTTFVNGSIKVNGETRADLGAGNLVEGISVPVTTAKQATVSFQVEVQNINDKDQIKNTAHINDEPTNETVTEYQEPIISQSKSADKTIVVAGETITYTITATNTGSLAGTAIIRDEIPTNTRFVEGSVVVDGTERPELTADSLVNGIEVSVPAKSGETVGTATVTFQVTVNSGATGSISNTAYVNDNQTGTVETPIITANKQASETRVEVGDTIKYTITLTNSSNVEGTFIVKDSIPANTTFTNESIAINGVKDASKTLSDLTTKGISVTVPAKGTVAVSFEVTVNEGTIAGTTIKNTATINGVPTNETTTTVVEPTLEISKTAETILDTDGNVEIPGQNKNEAEIGDTIVYTITVKNTSDVEADVNVTDTLPSAVTFERFTNNSAKATYSNGVVTYNGTLAGGQTLTIQFRATVNELASTMTGKEITNTAYVNEKPTSASTKVVKKVTLTTTAQTMNSLDLVLVLDVSTSMSNSGEIANLKTAAKNLANRVFSSETNSTITVITYAGTVRSTNTYDYDDRNNIITDIDRLGTHSGTNIYSALEEANSVVNGLLGNENAENRKRVVVFMTDGAPTFYTGGDNRNLAGLITAPNNSSNDWYYANNLRPQIIAQAESLKQKDVEVFAVGLGIDDLLSNRYQYAERENSSIDQSMFKEDQSTYIRENRRKVKCYRMTQKDYAQYLLNNIATSGEYIETSNLDSTFNDILSSQTTNKYSYKATDETLTITIPETRTIIADEDGKAVTVQIGNNTPVKYSLRELSGNGVNGLRYVNGEGFVWVVDTSILDEDLYISYKVEGVADDNQ